MFGCVMRIGCVVDRGDPPKNFKDWLLFQFADGRLSAKSTCEGAYHLGDTAKQHGVEHVARSPSSQSGSFNAFLDKQLGIDDFVAKYVFFAEIPQHTKKYGRKWLPHPFLCPHRQAHEFADDSTCQNMSVFDLPGIAGLSVVHEEGQISIALCRFYLDAVDTGGRSRKKAKQVYAFLWSPIDQAESLGARRLITVLLADRFCKSCGCGGRCTRNAVLKIITWSFAALRKKQHPSAGPWGEPLKGIWAKLAEQLLNCRGQVAHGGADWEAFADVLGTRRWNHKVAPCCWCSTDLAHMHDHATESPMLTQNDWENSKRQSRVTVSLTPVLASSIHATLAPDFRKDGSKGMALKRDIGARLTKPPHPSTPLCYNCRSSAILRTVRHMQSYNCI